MELEQIQNLIQTVSNSKLTQFSMEYEGLKLTMEKNQPAPVISIPGGTGEEQTIQVQPDAEEQEQQPEGRIIKSPLVGTFYNAQSPEAEPFVKVGDTVKKGQPLGIVEAMKLMNEIECEFDGVVKEILVENEQMVEYGQPLFVIG